MKIIKELDNLPVYVKFEYEARKAGVSEIDIAGIKSHTVLTATKLSRCQTYDKRVKSLKIFFHENSHLMTLTVDKRADLVILEKSEL